jgi:hypothetical protein
MRAIYTRLFYGRIIIDQEINMIAPVNTPSTSVSSRIISSAGEAAQGNVVAAQSDPGLVTPEDVNRRVTEVGETVNTAQQTLQQSQTEARTNALNTAANQGRQDLFDQYVAQSSGGSVDSSSSGASFSVADLQSFGAQNTAASQQNFDEVRAAQRELQQRFDDVSVPPKEPIFTIQI